MSSLTERNLEDIEVLRTLKVDQLKDLLLRRWPEADVKWKKEELIYILLGKVKPIPRIGVTELIDNYPGAKSIPGALADSISGVESGTVEWTPMGLFVKPRERRAFRRSGRSRGTSMRNVVDLSLSTEDDPSQGDLSGFDIKVPTGSVAVQPSAQSQMGLSGLSGLLPLAQVPVAFQTPVANASGLSGLDIKSPAAKADISRGSQQKDKPEIKGMWSCEHAKNAPKNFKCCPTDGKEIKFYPFDAATHKFVAEKLADLTESKRPEAFYDFVIEARGNDKWLKLNTCKMNAASSASGRMDPRNRIFVLSDDVKGVCIANKFDEICFLFSYLNAYHDFQDSNKSDARSNLEKEIDALIKYKDDIKPVREVVTAASRVSIFEDSDGKCFCCGRPITLTHFKVGHVLSVKHGGSSKSDNLKAICQTCNDDMGTAHMFEWMIGKDYLPADLEPFDRFHQFTMTYRLYRSEADNPRFSLDALSKGYDKKLEEIFELSNIKKYPFYMRLELLLHLMEQ
jgi:hypothetical protein